MKSSHYFLLPVFLLFSCRYDLAEKQAPSVNEFSAGTRFRINLPEEHKSGYIWQLGADYDNRKVELLNSVWHGDKKGVDFNFLARSAGTATLTFFKRMYRDTSEIRTYIMLIKPN